MAKKMTLDQQTKILEKLLQKPDNKQCAECPSRIPRWASITFGVFMCIRCSGVHRQLGVHITKVKSVNLDKWPDPKIEMFQNLSNAMVNSYWEKNLPANYKKPEQGASNYEVTEFLTNKYVHKKWANNDDWSNDPAWLYENKPKKFQKYVSYFKENFCTADQDNGKKLRPADSDSSDDGVPIRKAAPAKKGFGKPAKASRIAENKPVATNSAAVPDLLNMDTTPAAATQNQTLDSMLGGGGAAQNNDDGFGDFSAGGQNQVPVNTQNPQGSNQQQTINIQNLYQMYQANPHSANDKFSALDNVQIPGQSAPSTQQIPSSGTTGGGFQPQPNFTAGSTNQPFQPMAAAQGGNFGGGMGNFPQQQQQQPMGGSSFPQPQFGGSVPNQQQQQQNQFGGFQQSQQPQQFAQQQQQFGGFQQAPQQPQQFGGLQQNNASSNQFGGFQSAQTSQPQKTYANGLVDLSNLGNKNAANGMVQSAPFIPGSNTIQPMGQNQFGGSQQNSGFGNFQQQQPQGNQQKKDAFGGLVNF